MSVSTIKTHFLTFWVQISKALTIDWGAGAEAVAGGLQITVPSDHSGAPRVKAETNRHIYNTLQSILKVLKSTSVIIVRPWTSKLKAPSLLDSTDWILDPDKAITIAGYFSDYKLWPVKKS